MPKNPQAPARLKAAGRKFWREVVNTHNLRPDDLRVLDRTCRVLDFLVELDQELDGAPLIVEGSRGQAIANPLITERRLHQETLARLLRQLRLEDEDSSDGWSGLSTSQRARKAAMARWRKRPGGTS